MPTSINPFRANIEMKNKVFNSKTKTGCFFYPRPSASAFFFILLKLLFKWNGFIDS